MTSFINVKWSHSLWSKGENSVMLSIMKTGVTIHIAIDGRNGMLNKNIMLLLAKIDKNNQYWKLFLFIMT